MPADFILPPGLILIVAGLALPALDVRPRQALMLIAPAVTLALVWLLPVGSGPSLHFLGYDLVFVQVETLSRLFGIVFALMAFGGALYGLGQRNVGEMTAAFVYAGSAIGVIFAGDLITVFVFWELMAIGSTIVVWSGGRGAYGPGLRYAVMHLLGGVLLMAGIAGHVATTGSTAFLPMTLDSPAHWLILAGFLVNAGAPPLSAWLPDAYPAASYSGTVFLSAFTTKTAVYVLLRGFPGAEILVPIGLYMVFYGIIYGILENDIRRILCYSLVNQVGFMVTAIGIGTPMAMNGAVAHAFTHVIYKALLLMSAGSVVAMTGRSKCTELGGLLARMPVTALCGIVGGLSISAIPLTSGFVSKSMIAEGASEAKLLVVWLLITAGAVGVFIDIGLKWPLYIFFGKDRGTPAADPPLAMRLAMIFFAALCLGIGILPGPFYALLPFPMEYAPYRADHVISAAALLGFGALAFLLVLPFLKRTDTLTLDTDWLWRRPGRALARWIEQEFGRAAASVRQQGRSVFLRSVRLIGRVSGADGVFARAWPTGTMALCALLLLALSLILHYF